MGVSLLLGVCLIALLSAGAVRAECVGELDPVQPSVTLGNSTPVTAATAGSGGDWFLAFGNIVTHFNYTSTVHRLVAGDPTSRESKDGLSGTLARVRQMAFMNTPGNLIVLDGQLLRRITIENGFIRTLWDSPFLNGTVAMAAADTRIFFSAGPCLLMFDISISSASPTVLAGDCAQPASIPILVRAQSSAIPMPPVLGLSFTRSPNGDVIQIGNAQQFVARQVQRDGVNPSNIFPPQTYANVLFNGKALVWMPTTECVFRSLVLSGSAKTFFATEVAPMVLPGLCTAPAMTVLDVTLRGPVDGDFWAAVAEGTQLNVIRFSNCTGGRPYTVAPTDTFPVVVTGAPPTTAAPVVASHLVVANGDSQTRTIVIAVVVPIGGVIILLIAVGLCVGRHRSAEAPNTPASSDFSREPLGDDVHISPPALQLSGKQRGSDGALGNFDSIHSKAMSELSRLPLSGSGETSSSVFIPALSGSVFDETEDDTDKPLAIRPRRWTENEVRRHHKISMLAAEGAYHKSKMLGRGAHGSVFAVLLKDGTTIAVKEVHLTGSEGEIVAQMASVEREMDLLSRLHHDNVVTYYGVTCDREQLIMRQFMENVTGGSLGAMVRGMDERIPEETAQLFTLQLVRGLAFIHSKGIVHRDLKCDNILRDAHTGTVKLADFGTAKTVGTSAMASRAAQTMIGTPYYGSRDTWRRTSRYRKRARPPATAPRPMCGAWASPWRSC
jgi:hypothetical protein